MYCVARRCSRASLSGQVRRYVVQNRDTDSLALLADRMMQKVSVIDEVAGRPKSRVHKVQKKVLGARVQYVHGQPPPMDGEITVPDTGTPTTWDDSRNSFDVKPGDYVELGTSANMTAAVVVGQLYSMRKHWLMSFTAKGEVIRHSGDFVRFAIPGIISSDLATRCGADPRPANEHEHQARIKVLKYLNQLVPVVDKTTFEAKTRLKDAYALLANKDPTKSTTTDISSLARMFKRKPTFVDILAVNRFVFNSPEWFFPKKDYPVSQSVVVRSLDQYTRMTTIKHWMIPRSNPIHSFAEKAIPIMEEARRIRKESFSERPSIVKGSHEWSDNDKIIIKYLVDAVMAVNDEYPAPYHLARGYILKLLYPETLAILDHLVFDSLVDLGVFPPWQDLTLHLGNMSSDEVQLIVDRHIAKTQKSSSAAISNPTSQPLGPEDFYSYDPQEAIRHDWGDTPVYVIDQSSSKELDDGISFEGIPNEPDNCWVHAHVADPASFIPPTNLLAAEAERRSMSRYNAYKDEYMLPSNVTLHNSLPGMSLGAPGPQRTLSFSMKVNMNGDLLDVKVRSGIINNVVKLSYDTVDREMGWAPDTPTYPFGNPLPPDEHPVQLSERNREDLNQLYRVRDAFVQRRQRDGVFGTSEASGEVLVVDQPPNPEGEVSLDGQFYRGFLDTRWKVSEIKGYDTGSRSVVSEVMKIAGRGSSVWCRERDIPALRRVLPEPPIYANTDIDALLKSRDNNGYVDRILAIPFMDYDMKSTYSLDPGPHWSIGCLADEGYTRVTSPLRRYIDLQTHWQILHHLRGGKTPLFTRESLAAKAELIATNDRWYKREEGRNRIMWQKLFLERWMAEENRAKREAGYDPTREMTALVMNVPVRHSRISNFTAPVHIPSLGVRATISNMDSLLDVGVGQTVRVRNMQPNGGYHPSITVDLVK